ncbi:hypothetical protein BD780_000511 [Clostridium tetanomorphum]|uniref:Alpha-ribazole-5-phosphate synthase n=1 Tax=Clostridium tetanomorphum TaxID=1553 RepID=A0A923E745_CLOTT|nr:AIR synthase related protein [Clostridium tetanomorphum]KAJ50352.1 hypothetical protein CTM_18500 [Clostridium tetanomorphum DSM 665]MBC2397757.1 alpha-ribazole-5-phosphate synthase [Clostridium tetanomorphum]MBP1866034.1 hypothetical protein [Clostridium tetanomorphum]NRS83286.1 hypothetical protein [Clostridium tetanomorphum]NRZ96490.1 hypothetical protein [Clostridium tetanomorphum]
MKINKVRDLTLISIDENRTMVVACDSCGSIGIKEGDSLKIPNFYVGKFTVRVVLMEVLCSGAEVITVADAVCNEMNNTGKELIDGIKFELDMANINEVVLTGSTEENFKTTSTGLGVTAIGIVDNKKLKVNSISKECLLISIGIPKLGGELELDNDEDIADYKDLYKLLNTEGVYEIVPVGSKGILYEGELLTRNNGMQLILNPDININLKRTAGPATVLIAAVNNEVYNSLKDEKKINLIGEITKRED